MAMSGQRGALAVVVLAMALVSGCGTLAGSQRSSQFDLQMLGFENAVRWGQFKSADTYRKREPGQMPTDYPAYRDLRVTAYEVQSQVPADEGNRITRVVRVDYYWTSSPSVRSIEHVQEWVYDPQEGLWFLHSELPAFK